MSTNTECLFWRVLKIQNSKTLGYRDENVWLLIFRTWSNTVETNTKKIILDRKPWGPDLVPQVPKLPKQMTHQHKAGNLNWSHIWSFSQQSMLRLEISTPTVYSSFVHRCWQVQNQPELILQTLVGPLGLCQALLVGKAWHVTAGIIVRHSLQCCYFSPHIPAQPWSPAQ